MEILLLIILFTLFGSIFSLVGGVILLTKKSYSQKIIHGLGGFAAGVLLATAFFDLLPEALEEGGDAHTLFLWVVWGILLFFLIERVLHWFHHHHWEHARREYSTHPTIPLVMAGDTLHNLIDGIVIAATFMTDIRLGIVTTIAVAAHEIPQELGDFGLLLKKGMSRKQVLVFNVASAFVSVAGAVATFFVGKSIEGFVPILLALTAGLFIYISLSDIVPEIHDENEKGFALFETSLLITGVGVVYAAVQLLGH